ncbi:5'-nucleotidase C-terminal domain-containing protein [Algibacter sp. 2305UL17-15]|uniref:5'-nucleotidase C-terminal domain-containing protein n=1 Tax=Algibacter sp. 2305UL17-15 TaxID=3231268 RepID=UPI003457D318
MSSKYIYNILIIALFLSCKPKRLHLNKIEGKRIEINNELNQNDAIETFINPYRNHIEKDLDSVLAYAEDTYSKTDGALNTAIGNFMADIVFSEANPIFEKRTGNSIDAVLLNYGGIRSIIPKGPVTSKTAYHVMPFENRIVVVSLKGSTVNEAVNYLIRSSKAHPISGLNLIIDADNNLLNAKINGENIDADKTYFVATSDYLYNGGDHMIFFQNNEGVYDLDYKIRNVLIDYLKKTDTINPVIDDRFIRK